MCFVTTLPLFRRADPEASQPKSKADCRRTVPAGFNHLKAALDLQIGGADQFNRLEPERSAEED